MAVLFGTNGAINAYPTVRNWDIDIKADINEYVASNTAGGTGRLLGNTDWSGNLEQLGYIPMGAAEVFALSTQAFAYFQKLGYAEGTPDDLPPDRRQRYDQSGRHSKVLLKKITPALVPAQ